MHNATTPVETSPHLLDADEEVVLQRRIEAGVAAEAALAGWLAAPGGASPRDLRRIAAEGERARTAFARANTGLVWWVIAPIAQRTRHAPDELFQEGVVGLLEAIQRFDARRGRFSTYAVPRIKMRAWDAAVTAHGALGIPPRRARQWRQARAAVADLTIRLAREPRVDEVAEATGEAVEVVRSLLVFGPPVVLSPGSPGWDVVGPAEPPAGASDEVDRMAVRRLLRRLEDGDREVVARLFGLDGPVRSHAEVARELGCSESTVRRRERVALGILRAGAAARLAA